MTQMTDVYHLVLLPDTDEEAFVAFAVLLSAIVDNSVLLLKLHFTPVLMEMLSLSPCQTRQ